MKKTIVALIFVILIISFIAGYLIGFKGDNNSEGDSKLTSTPTETQKSTEVQRLWGDDPADTSVPTILTKEEYLYLYQQAIQSIKDRNFTDFSKLISYQRFWRLNYRTVDLLPLENKMPVFKVKKVNQEQSFYDFSILNILFYSPSPGQVVVERMENDDNTPNDNTPMRYYNSDEGIDMLVLQNGYKHTVTLTCHTVGLEYFSKAGSGKLVFVYDKGQWRFDWQYWNDQDIPIDNINLSRDFGDINSTNTAVDVNVPTRLDQKNFDLGEVTIQKGQTIKWKNVEGIVQSLVQASGDANWFSPYMNKGSFYKRFDGVGVYSYQIIYADYIFNGKIIVQ